MRILFLNQYFPPDPAPTGQLMREVGERLAAQGHAVDYVCSEQNYRTAKRGRGRMRRELAALVSILLRGWRARRPDLVISGSSPPCLLVAAVLIARRHRAKSIHWLFDMYPELAMALGELNPGLGSRVFEPLMGWAYRSTNRVVALDADMAERLKKYGVEAEVSRPWVFDARLILAIDPTQSDSELTWIYSGNLGRAHEWKTLLETQALLEKRAVPWRLIFQGDGPSWAAARARAAELGLKRCDWKPYVDESGLRASLMRARALIVTQLPSTKGLLWPSKLSLAMTLPRPLLWVGPVDGAIARELRGYPHAGIFSPGQASEIADWLQSLAASGVPAISKTFDAAGHRELELGKWTEWIASL